MKQIRQDADYARDLAAQNEQLAKDMAACPLCLGPNPSPSLHIARHAKKEEEETL